MSWTLTTASQAIIKAGVHANATIVADTTTLAKFSDEAEGRIETGTKRTWVANHTGLPDGVKGELSAVTSSMVAMDIVSYDTTGYLSREADTILNVNDEIIGRGMAILKDLNSNELKTP